jgi:AcrR family transcriptional regulator
MTMKKTRFSTSRKIASEQRSAIDNLVDSLAEQTALDSPEDVLQDLSDLGVAGADQLIRRWPELALPVRLALVREMVSRFESDIEHHFDRALIAALYDEDVDVKLGAFEGLTDTSEPLLLDYLLDNVQVETSPSVRAACSRILGQFVLESQLGRLDGADALRVRETVLVLASSDPDPDVRLQALESAGYLAGDQVVIDAIAEAWSSASITMTRSAHCGRWAISVIRVGWISSWLSFTMTNRRSDSKPPGPQVLLETSQSFLSLLI